MDHNDVSQNEKNGSFDSPQPIKVIRIDSNKFQGRTIDSPEEPILKTENLSCHFGGLHALNKISLEVGKGTVVVLLGKNGAGKSTFINCVSGFVGAKTGKVSLLGHDITHEKSWRISQMGLSRTFQIPRPLAGLSVLQYVTLAGLRGGQGRINKKRAALLAEEVLVTSGLSSKIYARPTELSTAELRRLELARALALRPSLILLDEPLGGLSPPQVEDYLKIIAKLKESGLTIVAVEHSVRAVLDMADDVVFLERGAIVRQGPPREVLSDKAVIDMYLGTRFVSRGYI